MPAICTIITPDWVNGHLVRWIRYVNKNLPTWDKYLYFLGDGMDKQFPGLKENFKGVKIIPLSGRPQFNRIRMSAVTDFGVDEILYLDADADVLVPFDLSGDLSGRSSLACVESPALHSDWVKMCNEKGWSAKEYNNGLLWMSEDWGDRYDKAVEAVQASGANPRIIGTIAFNYMLNTNEGWEGLPYAYGVIWWDIESFRGAKIIQYCNDKGQAKRLMLEEEFRASRLPR